MSNLHQDDQVQDHENLVVVVGEHEELLRARTGEESSKPGEVPVLGLLIFGTISTQEMRGDHH